MSNNKLEGKVAVITGGVSITDKTIACLFVDQGARVVMVIATSTLMLVMKSRSKLWWNGQSNITGNRRSCSGIPG
ncbi:hypothetical protein GOBAR_DD16829 [Gossypium barbadense]|nr:hypothetical protein GOBAR_DD16829 [Gossypium barbadense]